MTLLEIKKILQNRNYKKILKSQENEIMRYIPFAETFEEALYAIKNDILEKPICQYPGCNNKIPHRWYSTGLGTYSIGCGEDHTKRLNNLKKYGVENVSQLKEVQEKKEATTMKHHGVKNPKQNPIIASKIENTMKALYGGFGKKGTLKDKIENTCLERFGTLNPMHADEHRLSLVKTLFDKILDRLETVVKPNFTFEEYQGSEAKQEWICVPCGEIFPGKIDNGGIPRCPKCFPNQKKSYGEMDLFNSINIQDKIQGDWSILLNKELDIYIPSKKIAIEFNGIYWHSEARGKFKNYHLDKTIRCEEQGIQLIHIFESEWVYQQEIIKSIIASKLGNFDNKISARKCIIKEIDILDKNNFLDENHLEGSVESNINLGLFYNDELVFIMCFKSLKNNHFELIRYCSKLNTMVYGGLSKLLNTFKLNYFPKSIKCLIDRRFSFNHNLQKFDFKLKGTLPPSHFFISKDKLIKPENNLKDGKNKIWNCGYYNFVWTRENLNK